MGSSAVGYVVRTFPHPTQTFVANEIRALEERGLQIQVFAYRRSVERVDHDIYRHIRAPVTHLPDPTNRYPSQAIRATVATFAREPRRFVRTVAYVLRHTVRERNLDTWRRFIQAACLSSSATEAGVRHLHAHFADGATRIAMLASMLTGLPYTFSAHARDIYRRPNYRMLREKIARARWVATCSAASQAYLRSLLLPTLVDRVRLLHHGVDIAKFAPGANAAGSDALSILSAGRLVDKKGFPDLVRACGALRAKGVRVRCQIVGDGPLRTQLQQLIDELELRDIVTLPGACSQEELLERYRNVSLFALPCRVLDNGDRDGIPNVTVEAMAIGLPVVSTKVSGIPELIVDDQNGLLVEPNDPAALADAIERLLLDPELRRRLGSAARATVARSFDTSLNIANLYRWFTADARVEPARSQ